jgi:protoheme IX farnesyltransferase
MESNKSENQVPLKRFRTAILTAGILVFILIAVGGITSAGSTGNTCPDWPTCFGSWTPPETQSAVPDYAHRAITGLAAPFLLAAAWMAWRHYRRQPLLFIPTIAALVAFTVQILFGAWIVLTSAAQTPLWLNVAHLSLSLLAVAGVALAAVASYYPESARRGLAFRTSFARLSLVLLGALLLLFVSGAIVKGSGSSAACQSWPLCSGGLIPTSGAGWLHLVHRGLTAITGILIGVVFYKAWRSQRTQPAILTATTAAAVLFFAQALLGARLVQVFPAYLKWLHQATAVAAWAALAVQVAAVGLADRSGEEEKAEALATRGRNGLARDFLMLTKPIVVALLLVTTYAGMVIGAQAWPSLTLTFWTLLGGFLAAGGSGAINQYIDRYDDTKMQRTQKRPIPAGRLTPGEGLAFGVGIALASVYLLTAFVSFLAAMLALAGIVYYVLLYSIFLKKTTVQNIVIGGGAGAIPPLVGWAAATGGLNIPSLFLFAIVFMWTPPHFWALALVRRKDYARAGVPMLPVVRGEKETRGQIMLYTLELVALTLLLPVFGLGGSIYFIGAAALGSWLILTAWRVWREGGNKPAWKMYRYSSMYLAFLFVVLMIDRLA